MRSLIRLSFLAATLLFSSTSLGEIVLIVHPDNPVKELSRDQIIKIYMGRNLTFPTGKPALPLDMSPSSHSRQQFYNLLVNKSVAEINAYWARLLFTGRATPPRPVADAETLLETVRENPAAIGYIDVDSIDNSVKVVAHVKGNS